MRMLRALATLVVIASVARADSHQAVTTSPPALEQLTLGNGLRVILAPDPATSFAAVHVRYASGTAIEAADQAGYTKLVEKLLGKGSVHVKDFDARIEAVGGWATTTTTSDYLGMTEHVPAHALELVLWLEAERMAGLPDGISEAGLALAREELRDEWRAAYVELPYGLVVREAQRVLWSGELARYGKPVLGDGKAVHRAQLSDVRRFARGRMTPNNAILVIAGRFDAAHTRKLVTKYFGWLPKRETVAGGTRVELAALDAPVERTVDDPLGRILVGFRVDAFAPATAVAAHVLATKLRRELVEAQLATDVDVELVQQHAGELRVVVAPALDIEPARVLAATKRALAAPAAEDEIVRAARAVERDFLLAIENLGVRADLLASFAMYRGELALGDWPTQLQRVRSVPPLGHAVTVISSRRMR